MNVDVIPAQAGIQFRAHEELCARRTMRYHRTQDASLVSIPYVV
jgi:hypothetical protein